MGRRRRVGPVSRAHLASGREVRLPLTHGSLVVMHGESQSAWQHAVPATDEPVGPRPNLTFRWWH